MRIIRVISLIVIFIGFLCIYAFAVRHVLLGGQRFGNFTEPIKSFIEFPMLINRVFTGDPKPYHVTVEDDFLEINLLEDDLYALNAHYEPDKYIYVLSNLRNDSMLHSWSFPKSQFVGPSNMFPVAHPKNPVLLKDKSMIGMLNGTKNLFRLDRNSNVVWHNTSKIFHHSLNLSKDDYLWCCTEDKSFTKNEGEGSIIEFRDDFITKVDVETGEILFDMSLSEILIRNGYINMVHGFGNEERSEGTDLFHLNDIEPIFFSGKYWNEGDLFLSLRNRSLILHYRPSSNRILRVISGPFLLQHDVDILSETEVSIFNNNRTHTMKVAEENKLPDEAIKFTIKSSNIVIYNFFDSTFRTPSIDVFESEIIYTGWQGIHAYLSNGDLFVESTQSGKIYVIRDNEIILRKYPNAVTENNTTEYPHWMRIYETLNFN